MVSKRTLPIFMLLLSILMFCCSKNSPPENDSSVKTTDSNTENVNKPKNINENLKISEEEKEKIIKDWENEKQKFLSAENEDWFKDAPKTLKEGMELLDKKMSKKNKELFKNVKEDDGGSLHFGMGMGLRNSWGLWAKSKLYYYFYARGITHPDDMSGVIIESYIKHLQGKELRTEIEMNNPEYFEMVDAIISGENDKFLKLLTTNKDLAIKKVVDNVSPVDIAIETCNSYALSTLLNFGAQIFDRTQDCKKYKKMYGGDDCEEKSFTLEYAAGCGNEILSLLIEKEPSFIKKKEFFTEISRKSDILSKYCDLIPEKMKKKKLEELLINAAEYGSFDDIKCVAGKMKEEEVKFPLTVLASEKMTPEKEQFILKHISSVQPERKELIEAFSDLILQSDEKRITKTIKLFSLKPEEINTNRIIYRAMINKKVDVLETLFNEGLDINYKDPENGESILFPAVEICNPSAIDLLLEKGVNLNAKSIGGEEESLPIFEILYNSCRDKGEESVVIKYLILRGMDVSGSKAQKEISTIVGKESLDLLKFFISAGADINKIKKKQEDEEKGDLLRASMFNNKEMFDFIFKEGNYNINKKRYCNTTYLHNAVQLNNYDVIKEIIKIGADLNAVTAKGCNYMDAGNTPLMYAIIESNGFGAPSFEVVKLLVDAGADISIKNDSGLTVLDMAKMELKEEEKYNVQSLKKYGRSYNSGEIARLKEIISFLESKNKTDN